MGCKYGVFLTTIPKALGEGALSGTDLLKRARELIPPEKKLAEPKKPFIEALNCLLHEKKIQIESYDISLDSRERKQSLSHEGFIFSLVKTEPLDILYLINNVEKGESEGKKAFYELRRLFSKKVTEIESENKLMWESLLNHVTEMKPSVKEILWYSHVTKISEEETKNEKNYTKELIKELNFSTGEIEEDITPELSVIRKLFPQFEEGYEATLFLLEMPEKAELGEYGLKLNTSNPKAESITKNHLLTNKKLTKEEFLTEIGFQTPINRSHNIIDELFQEVFSYINSQEKGRDALVNRFARGLTDRNNSKEFLTELVYEATGKKEYLIDYSPF